MHKICLISEPDYHNIISIYLLWITNLLHKTIHWLSNPLLAINVGLVCAVLHRLACFTILPLLILVSAVPASGICLISEPDYHNIISIYLLWITNLLHKIIHWLYNPLLAINVGLVCAVLHRLACFTILPLLILVSAVPASGISESIIQPWAWK